MRDNLKIPNGITHWFSWRRSWMLAGFCAAIFIGDYFLAIRAAPRDSAEFLVGVVGFGLAQVLWTVGQLRESRPDGRVFLAVALPLVLFVYGRMGPPTLPHAGQWAVGIYSVLTALSLATALASRRATYFAGICLLLFSDMMIGGGFLGAEACNSLILPTYLASEFLLLASLLWQGEWRVPCGRVDTRGLVLIGGAAAFACFTIAGCLYPGGGYNPFLQMLSALGRTEVRNVPYPACHWWFIAGMLLSGMSVGMVWARLVREERGGRRFAIGWGGAVNVAGLCAIAFVPENVNMGIHNVGCFLAVGGGIAVLIACFRRGKWTDIVWLAWFAVVVTVFALCIHLDSIPFRPYVPTSQKALIVSFAVWAASLAWRAPPQHNLSEQLGRSRSVGCP